MRQLKNRKGIVGIEAAIVLIAFVVIAAALSYVVINMGFFATQKTKETIAEGIAESTAALQLDGTVTAKTSGGAPLLEEDEVIGTQEVAGIETEFSGTLAHHPIVTDSLTITATMTAPATVTITDDLFGTPGDGILQDADPATVTGTIDYDTGDWTLDFGATGPDADTDITATYNHIIAGKIEHIVFPVKLSVGNAEVDLGSDSVVVSVYLPSSTLLDIYEGCDPGTDKDLELVLVEVVVDSAEFRIYNGDADTVLESKEKAFLVVHLDTDKLLSEYEKVKIEVKTGRGAALTVVRTAPGGMSPNSYVDLG